MATLTELYEDYDFKQGTKEVVINGVKLVNVLSVEWHFAFEQVPTATVIVPNPIPDNVEYMAPAFINVGYNGVTARVFTGYVLHPSGPSETEGTIELIGSSWPLDVTYHKVIVDIDGVKSADTLVEELMDSAGIENYNVSVPAWTPGTNAPQTLEFDTFGEAIKKIAEVDGCRWWETPTGTVVVRPADPIPGNSAWRNYFSMQLTGLVESYPAGIASGRPRLRRCSKKQDVRSCKNQIFVKGATYTQANADNTESNIEVEGDASGASVWVRNPDGTQAYNDELFSNEIIDTAAKAAEVAGRICTLKNRLWETVSIDVDGDPQIQLGKTIRIEDPDYSGVNGRWFLESYSTRIDSNEFSTQVTALGGDSGGTTNIAPFALFTWAIDYEVMGNAVWAIVTFDASESFDSDGTIASWVWTDNQIPMVANGAGEQYTVRIDPSTYVSPWEVTLTVTDNDGDTDSITLTVTPETGFLGVWIPSIFAAAYNFFSASPDGGINWNTQAGVGVVSVGADLLNPGIACYGTEGGAIYRTTDACASAPILVMAACGHQIVDIKWDRNYINNVWALTINGLLYRSEDNGVTWYLYEDLAAKFGLAGIIGNHISTPPPNNVWIFGGTGTGWPLICFEMGRTHNWNAPTIGGEMAADLATFGYPADVYIAQAHSGYLGQLVIILNSAAMTTAVFWTDDVHGDGSAWKRAVGLPAKSRGRWLIGNGIIDEFSFGYDDSVIYTGTIAAGVMNVAVAAASLDVGVAGHWGLDMAPYIFGMSDVHLLAAVDEVGWVNPGYIYKTFDHWATQEKMYPAVGFPVPPAGTRIYQIECGLNYSEDVGRVLIAAGTNLAGVNPFASTRVDTLSWNTSLLAGTGMANEENLMPRCLTSNLWFILAWSANNLSDEAIRTKDGGTNWNLMADPDVNYKWQDFCLDAGGRLWGLALNITDNANGNVKIFYSDDGGDTWILSYTNVGAGGVASNRPNRICASPTNSDVIAAIGGTWATTDPLVFYTIDGGSSWTRNSHAASYCYYAYISDVKITSSDRIVMVTMSALNQIGIMTTDDWGATWTVRQTFGASANYHCIGPTGTFSGQLLYVLVGDNIGGTWEGNIWVSGDSGTTWAVLGCPSVPQQGPNDWGSGGIAYDEIADVLYVWDDGPLGVCTNISLVSRLKPVKADSEWEDFTDTLLPIGGVMTIETSGLRRQHIAIVPRG